MRTLVILCIFAVLAGVALGGGHGWHGGFGGGFGGGSGGGYGHGYSKTVPGPTFLVKTVHHVNKVSHGGVHSSHLIGIGGHGGGYGGGFGGGIGGGYGHGWH